MSTRERRVRNARILLGVGIAMTVVGICMMLAGVFHLVGV